MIDLLLDPNAWLALLTLTALELVLGIDNIIFISILVERLPAAQQQTARRAGLGMAMLMRLGLLLLLSWIFGLTRTLFLAGGHDFSGRDLILIGGGLFLLWKSTREIHHLLEGSAEGGSSVGKDTFLSVILQITVIDIVFSLDSIITAVGMVDEIEIMMTAVVLSVGLMPLFAGSIARLVAAHPTIKVLALAFLLVVGVVLVADGFDTHIPKGYVYFAMAFSVAVEAINLRLRRRSEPVILHQRFGQPAAAGLVLFVDDLPRVATFYEAVLGVAPVRAGNERAEFNGPTLQLALQRRPDAVGSDPAPAPVPLPPAATGRYHLRVTVEDLARARVAALATGGHIDEPAGAVAEQQPVSLGRDPEGNVIEVWSR